MSGTPVTRINARRAALWALPSMVFLLLFYWRGLSAWFQADDFAWLSLWREIRTRGDLLPMLFQPLAQGTVRPLSERIPYLLFPAVFGLTNWPFRIVAFALQLSSLSLLAWLAWRITGSRAVAVVAPVFWAASASLAIPMVWTAPGNQLGCAFFFMAALVTWIHYCDTGRPGLLVLHWLLFLCGIGTLEIFVVYPAVALAWRDGWKRWRALAPMFAASAAYTVWHTLVAPKPAGKYVLHLDSSIATTLATYVGQLFGGPLLHALPVSEAMRWAGAATPWLVGLPMVVFLVRKRDARCLLPLALIFVPLVPVLPLRDHITLYYLVTSAAGFGLLLAWCCVEAYKSGGWRRIGALGMAGLFMLVSLPASRGSRDFYADRGERVRTLMLGLASARQQHPNQVLVLTGLDGHQFYAAIGSEALRAMDLHNIYLAPGAAEFMEAIPGEPAFSQWELDEGPLQAGLANGAVLVYAPSGTRLRNITATYRAVHLAAGSAIAAPAARVEPASAPYERQLGAGWLAAGGEARWFGQRAAVTVGGRPKSRLVVEGYAPEVQFRDGPFRFEIWVERVKVGQFSVQAPGGLFRFAFDVPSTVVVTPSWNVEIVADHTVPIPGGDHASVLISRFFLEPV